MDPPCTQDSHGVPQGSVLGPIQYIGELYLTALSDIFFMVNERIVSYVCILRAQTNVTWVMYGVTFYAGDCKL